MVTTEVPSTEAGDHAVVEVDRDGRVTGFAYKPDDPATGTVATEIIVYDPPVLVEVLEELHRELRRADEATAGDTGLGDFGDHLSRGWSSAAGPYAHALRRATGATSASRTTTSTRTSSCSIDDPACFDDPAGRS